MLIFSNQKYISIQPLVKVMCSAVLSQTEYLVYKNCFFNLFQKYFKNKYFYSLRLFIFKIRPK